MLTHTDATRKPPPPVYDWGFSTRRIKDAISLTRRTTASLCSFSRAAIPDLTIKFDVMGYANPEGWQYRESGRHVELGGIVHGSVRMCRLEAGTVRVRMRCFASDGNGLVAEGSADYFLSPQEVRTPYRQGGVLDPAFHAFCLG